MLGVSGGSDSVALTFLMRRRISRINGRDILVSLAKIFVASAAMSAAAYAVYYLLHSTFDGRGFTMRLIETMVPIAVAGVVFVIAAKLLRIDEIEKIYRAFSRKLGRR